MEGRAEATHGGEDLQHENLQPAEGLPKKFRLRIYPRPGEKHKVRAMLDLNSKCSLMSKSQLKKMQCEADMKPTLAEHSHAYRSHQCLGFLEVMVRYPEENSDLWKADFCIVDDKELERPAILGADAQRPAAAAAAKLTVQTFGTKKSDKEEDRKDKESKRPSKEEDERDGDDDCGRIAKKRKDDKKPKNNSETAKDVSKK